MLQPLLNAVKATKPEEVDNVVVRIYVGAIRAHMAEDNLDKAAEAAMLLAESGPDAENVNGALVEVVKMLNDKRKQAQTEAEQTAGNAKSTSADDARDKLKSINELMNKLLVKMSSRKEFSIIAAVYYADACLAAGLPDVARTTYLRVANRAEKDAAYAKSAGKALAWVRARLVDLLAKTGDYEEAYKQVTHLVAANPRAGPADDARADTAVLVRNRCCALQRSRRALGQVAQPAARDGEKTAGILRGHLQSGRRAVRSGRSDQRQNPSRRQDKTGRATAEIHLGHQSQAERRGNGR